MKINWPIIQDEMIFLAIELGMGISAVCLVGVILLMTGVVK